MRPRGEELRHAGRLEASFRETEGGPETSTTGTDDDGIVFVVLRTLIHSPMFCLLLPRTITVYFWEI